MKKIIYILCTVLASNFLTSCGDDFLETQPTDQTSGTIIFKDAKSAETAINGIYGLLYKGTYVSGNIDQGYGYPASMICQDIMGEDMVQMDFGWFGFDYELSDSKRFSSTATRPYYYWNMNYTIISNCNYITAQDGQIAGDQNLAKSVVAQAYTMRAWAYFNLIQIFQQTYIGNEQNKGVPLYTEPVRAGSKGKGRGTVEEVYTQINNDLGRAIALFTEIGKPKQTHCSNVDYYVANAVKARIALVQNQWEAAYNAAKEALQGTDTPVMSSTELASGMNSKKISSVLWAMEIIPDQSPRVGFGSYFNHMDGRGPYGKDFRKCISNWLYNQLPAVDLRKQNWWLDNSHGNAYTGVEVNYGQIKVRANETSSWSGDVIFTRGEEMILIQAEAKCRLKLYKEAKDLLKILMAKRYSDGGESYNSKLEGLTQTDVLSSNTTNAPTTLLDEIILQRRVELWGEGFRILDLLRLKQGYSRNWTGTNHKEILPNAKIKTDVYPCTDFIMLIPQSEFNGNPEMNPSIDQNPI